MLLSSFIVGFFRAVSYALTDILPDTFIQIYQFFCFSINVLTTKPHLEFGYSDLLEPISQTNKTDVLQGIAIALFSSLIFYQIRYFYRRIRRYYKAKKQRNIFKSLVTNDNDSEYDVDPAEQVRVVFRAIRNIEKRIDALKNYRFKLLVSINHIVTVILILTIFVFSILISIAYNNIFVFLLVYFIFSFLWAEEIFPSLSSSIDEENNNLLKIQKKFFVVSIFIYIYFIINNKIIYKNNCINKSISHCKWLLLYSFPSNNRTLNNVKEKDTYIIHLNHIINILSNIREKNIIKEKYIQSIEHEIESVIDVIHKWPDSCNIYSTLDIPEVKQISIESSIETQEED